ncbi:MAG TPA: BatD family protein, partial [Patescibacteria group bacterium]|nr:BatD family protein [Patescibacteria group bacterium]
MAPRHERLLWRRDILLELRVSALVRASMFGLRILALACLLIYSRRSSAQPATPATQDPMMQLMLAQPKIDVGSPVTPVVSFDPAVVKPGEESTYRVTFNALETAIEWPDKIPIPTELSSRAGAHGQILSLGGALLIPRTTFNYHVRPAAPGKYTIPEFNVVVNGKPVKIPATDLEVTATPPPGTAAAQQLLFQLPSTNLFVGQSVRARIVLPGTPSGVIQSLAQAQINGQGFIVDQSSAHARIEAIPLPNSRRTLSAFVYELVVTPIATGKISLFAQGYAVGNRVIGGIIMPGPGMPNNSLPQYTLVDSSPIRLEVRPLPRGSELPGFTGAVGSYSIDPPELSTNTVAVGEPLKLRVKVRGDGNLARLVPPQPPHLNDWQIFAAPLENIPSQIVQAQGFVTFNYTLIPLTDKPHSTPAIPFSSFEPDRA